MYQSQLSGGQKDTYNNWLQHYAEGLHPLTETNKQCFYYHYFSESSQMLKSEEKKTKTYLTTTTTAGRLNGSKVVNLRACKSGLPAEK